MVSAMKFKNVILYLKANNLIFCPVNLAVQGPITKQKPLVRFDVEKAERLK